MTVYRHFPTKGDLVLFDHNGRLVAERIAATPAEQPLVHRIGSALIDSVTTLTGGGAELTDDGKFLLARLQLMISTPALRAKDNNYALGAEEDGRTALPGLIAEALTAAFGQGALR
ncbi:hypothetical protein HNR02_002739 [Amycolatopsis endophytica]|uniref:TetR family transcriptional regulator n=2 Tax=Amycolatopsis endophytica TaxID=860233 RepID=A0A853B465_9PSEU|nr:hypothetical protein [Amycolatopsis endophytica]NYI89416.1 hypothetical protein [Amycolatopsis endophytica]